jgi:chromosome segregation ATPase
MAKSNANLDRLETAHKQAATELDLASAAATEAAEQLAETERELNHQQRTLDALEGRNHRLREKLLDSVEYANVNTEELAAKIKGLWKQLHGKTAKLKEANARLDAARKAEQGSFYQLAHYRHREAVRALLRAEIAYHDLLIAERDIRAEVAGREGGVNGSLPVFVRPNFDGQVTRHRLNAAAECGYIDGSEPQFSF